MKFSLFKRNRPASEESQPSRPLSPALPDAADLHVDLRLAEQHPFRVELHDMNIQGAQIIVPFHVAPLQGEGEVVELIVKHIQDGWNVTTVAFVRSVEKISSDEVMIDIQFTNLGELYAQLDDALGRYFNRRSAARVRPELASDVKVKLAYGAHRVRGVAHDLSMSGLGATITLAQAVVFKGGERAEVTIDIPDCQPEFVGPCVIKHGYRQGPNVVLGVEFDLLAESPMRKRRNDYVKYIDRRYQAMEAWQQELSRPA